MALNMTFHLNVKMQSVPSCFPFALLDKEIKDKVKALRLEYGLDILTNVAFADHAFYTFLYFKDAKGQINRLDIEKTES